MGPAEAEAMKGLGAEVEFAPNEAMLPSRIDVEAVGPEADATGVIGAAEEDGGSARAGRRSGGQGRRGGAASWRAWHLR